MFENCFPEYAGYDSVNSTMIDGQPDTYVITGDIDAMWLRDSYGAGLALPAVVMKEDADLQQLIAGVINRQTRHVS